VRGKLAVDSVLVTIQADSNAAANIARRIDPWGASPFAARRRSLDVVDITGDVLGGLVFLSEVAALTTFDLVSKEARADSFVAGKGDLVVRVTLGDTHLMFHVVGRPIER